VQVLGAGRAQAAGRNPSCLCVGHRSNLEPEAWATSSSRPCTIAAMAASRWRWMRRG
jgi:hypothetical protein